MNERELVDLIRKELSIPTYQKRYKKPNTSGITVKLDQDTLNELCEIAYQKDIAVSALCRELIKKGLKHL